MPLLCAPARPTDGHELPRRLHLRRPGHGPMTSVMFQTYDPPEPAQSSSQRVERLREMMAKRGLDALLVPRVGRAPGRVRGRRRPSACAGSPGFPAPPASPSSPRKAAALFVDGRYTMQARDQIDAHTFQILRHSATPNRPSGCGAQLSRRWRRRLRSVAAHWPADRGAGENPRAQGHQAQGARQPIPSTASGDGRGRPRRARPSIPHPLKYAGKAARAEARRPAGRPAQGGAGRGHSRRCPIPSLGCSTSAAPTSPHNPVPLAFAVLPATGKAELFIDPAKVGAEAQSASERHRQGRASRPPRAAADGAETHGQARPPRPQYGRRAGSSASSRAAKRASSAAPDPCLLPKARQERRRDQGRARGAHARRGRRRALSRLARPRVAPRGTLDEIAAVRQLETSAAKPRRCSEISFDTISGAGPNGAIVHYRVTDGDQPPAASRASFSHRLRARNTSTAPPTSRARSPSASRRARCSERFTLVLKGHIAIATARFPKGTRGVDLDPFARRALWEAGLDFDHGTGHGIGSYLSVHEGPQRISQARHDRARAGHDHLQRARLLQGRRLRHPHREPGAGRRAAEAGRRRSRDHGVRNAHACAHGPAARSCPSFSRLQSSTGSTPIMRACARSSARSWDPSTAPGWRRRRRPSADRAGMRGKRDQARYRRGLDVC